MKKIWRMLDIYTVMIAVSVISALVVLFIDITAFAVTSVAAVVCAVIAIIESIRVKKKLSRYIEFISKELTGTSSKALRDTTIPIIVATASDEIIWYNPAFSATFEGASTIVSKSLADLAGHDAYEQLVMTKHGEITFGSKIYKIHRIAVTDDQSAAHVYMLFNITKYRKLKQQYQQSRPVVAIVDIDNFEEITRGIKDADAAAAKSIVHNRIEKWAETTSGIVRRVYNDRYMMVFDERDIGKLIEDKFSVLETVREIKIGESSPTLSIGIGRAAETLSECEDLAAQALDMAQSRGGDQVAIKNAQGEYKFFGGLSAATEKHTKTKARIVASAMKELIKGSENVVIMGHKYADLDCLGSAYGLYKLAKTLEKDAYVVLNETNNMAKPLYERICGMNEDFKAYSLADIIHLINKKTLLIITDVHRAAVVEEPELLNICGPTIIIDHHRKAVDFIEGAVIFYHETAASSASEMVTEILQYANPRVVGQTEAEALLSGIMLDSRNFVMNTGVRTFEASAFLRNKGADPISVKKLFSGSMPAYKQRANIVATAQIYGNAAIAVNTENDENTRLATAQAADELLGIRNVAASFVICKLDNGQINISARSLGSVNVQLIMETLGGGGHRTMAACQLKGVGFEEAAAKLKLAIDAYRKEMSK